MMSHVYHKWILSFFAQFISSYISCNLRAKIQMNLHPFYIDRTSAIVISAAKDEKYTTTKVGDGPLKLITCTKFDTPKKSSAPFKKAVATGLWIPPHLLEKIKLPFAGSITVGYNTWSYPILDLHFF